jgi:hypothetical protein
VIGEPRKSGDGYNQLHRSQSDQSTSITRSQDHQASCSKHKKMLARSQHLAPLTHFKDGLSAPEEGKDSQPKWANRFELMRGQ